MLDNKLELRCNTSPNCKYFILGIMFFCLLMTPLEKVKFDYVNQGLNSEFNFVIIRH